MRGAVADEARGVYVADAAASWVKRSARMPVADGNAEDMGGGELEEVYMCPGTLIIGRLWSRAGCEKGLN